MKLNHDADVAVTVYMRRPKNGDAGYVSAYTDYPTPEGTDYYTGNDLADGGHTEKTIERVVADLKAVFAGRRNSYEATHGT